MNIVPDNLFVAMVENQMLSIIFFAILMGFFITKTKEKSQKILEFFDSLFELIMKITLFVDSIYPLWIFGIVAKQIAENNDLGELFSRLGLFMLVVILRYLSMPLLFAYRLKNHWSSKSNKTF